jgi:hypothetical protein
MRFLHRHHRSFSILAGLLLAAVGYVVLSRLSRQSWPLAHARFGLLAAAVAVFLGGLVLRFLGWRSLFARRERPSLPISFAVGAAAAIGSPALPMKLDYALKVWLTRRLSHGQVGVEAGVISLFALGMVDAAALTIPAAVAAGFVDAPAIRYPLLVVAIAGVVFAFCYLAAARLHKLHAIQCRPRLVRWSASFSLRISLLRDNLAAYGLLSASLWARSAGLLLLLMALGIHATLLIAVIYICLTAGSAFIPIPSFTVGAGTAALVGLGIGVAKAATFGLAVSLLGVFAAVCLLVGISAFAGGRALHGWLRPAVVSIP